MLLPTFAQAQKPPVVGVVVNAKAVTNSFSCLDDMMIFNLLQAKWCAHQKSNLDQKIRNLLHYPLCYEREVVHEG